MQKNQLLFNLCYQRCWGSAAELGTRALLKSCLENFPGKMFWDICFLFNILILFLFLLFCLCNTGILRVKLQAGVELSAMSGKRASCGCSIFQTIRQCLWKQSWMDQWVILLQWRDQKSLKFINYFNRKNCCSNKLQSNKALKVNSDFWGDCHSSQHNSLQWKKGNNPSATIMNHFMIQVLWAPFQVLWLRTTCPTRKAKLWKSVISGHYI